MMIEISALSMTARAFRSLIATGVGLPEDQILIGHPTEATSTGNADTTGKQYLNLFFYQVRYDGYPADATVDDPIYIRLHCLVTAFGANESSGGNMVTAGENDLRLIGSVMRLIHQHPELRIKDADKNEVGQLQLVPIQLNLDDINHIWATQGDTPYRLSIGYEIALLPLPLAERVERGPMVVSLEHEVFSGMKHQDSHSSGPTTYPIVPRVVVDTAQPDWAPHICFVYKGACAYVLEFDPAGHEWKDQFDPEIWVAGEAGVSLSLQWEQLDSESGMWEPLGNAYHADIPKQPKMKDGSKVIDPESCVAARTVSMYKYESTHLRKTVVTQRRLTAVRTYEKDLGGGKSRIVNVASNPLLLVFRPAGMN